MLQNTSIHLHIWTYPHACLYPMHIHRIQRSTTVLYVVDVASSCHSISHNHVTGISTYPQSPLSSTRMHVPITHDITSGSQRMYMHEWCIATVLQSIGSAACLLSLSLSLCHSHSPVPEVRLMHPLPVKKIPLSHIHT